jgi:hypothetical protein
MFVMNSAVPTDDFEFGASSTGVLLLFRTQRKEEGEEAFSDILVMKWWC